MANVQRGEATIMLDKERTIKFDLNALIDVEESLGFSLADLGDNMSIKAMRTLLTAGLRHEDEELTERQVGSLITMDNMKEVQEALGVAMGDVKN
jgi:CO dehydrogenase/acetyl-CoA synthase epsilon subunit